MKDQERFSQVFADIWEYSPFRPSSRVAEFLKNFVVSGRFDAERFWEFVTVQEPLRRERLSSR
ncbi:MAG: hypothetical protein DMG70_13330 [Acidobacteria bacterium]|nr:MAG: hypothetical protein DMG70_13330 [Acidobacteriota bacterium]PYY07526.1 MAG: hypothetical protein DMG69_18890 [Acidobacteriota bacterium]